MKLSFMDICDAGETAMFVPTMAVVKGRYGVDMGAIAVEALREIDMQHKEAWIAQGYPNASQWSKAIKGDAPLDLWAMRHLPNRFWQAFLPKVGSALIRQWLLEETEDHLRMARAALSEQQDERKRA